MESKTLTRSELKKLQENVLDKDLLKNKVITAISNFNIDELNLDEVFTYVRKLDIKEYKRKFELVENVSIKPLNMISICSFLELYENRYSKLQEENENNKLQIKVVEDDLEFANSEIERYVTELDNQDEILKKIHSEHNREIEMIINKTQKQKYKIMFNYQFKLLALSATYFTLFVAFSFV